MVDAGALRGFATKILMKLDVPEDDARATADVLVSADLRGIDSHGIARLWRYVTGLKRGLIEANPDIKVVKETPTTLLLDAGNGLGQVAGVKAMKRCIEKALESGMAFVAVRNSNHYGIAGYYAMMALQHDMMGLSLTNSSPLVVPTYGKEVMYGTNPIAFAVPTGEERPFVLDMATSVVPVGKIEVLRRKGEKIPPGWAVDSEGRLTDDPDLVVKEGRLLPLGGTAEMRGYKGYGLGVSVDILCGLLSGAAYGPYITRWHMGGRNEPVRLGHFFGAIKIEAFRPIDEFKRDMDDMIRKLKESPKAEGENRIFIHGEKEYEMEDKRKSEGIPLHPKVADNLKEIGEELGVEYNL
jgi:L-2-hydroxycarboxylate dehydrogenase (NAD+)